MKSETKDALKWIVTVLNGKNIPYKLGGGMAMYLYGSTRSVNDIDISIQGKYFPIIIPEVKDYVISGPKQYKNSKWDCTTLSLKYMGQEIDLTDVDTLLMSTKDGKKWIENKYLYRKYPDITIELDGIKINLMNPKVLLEYKNELDGEHQLRDIEFLKEYVKKNNL